MVTPSSYVHKQCPANLDFAGMGQPVVFAFQLPHWMTMMLVFFHAQMFEKTLESFQAQPALIQSLWRHNPTRIEPCIGTSKAIVMKKKCWTIAGKTVPYHGEEYGCLTLTVSTDKVDSLIARCSWSLFDSSKARSNSLWSANRSDSATAFAICILSAKPGCKPGKPNPKPAVGTRGSMTAL